MTDAWLPVQNLNTPILQQHRRFLSVYDPDFLRRVEAESASENLVMQNHNGLFRVRSSPEGPWIFGEHDPWQELQQIKDELRRVVQKNQLLVLLGSANGYVLTVLLPLFLREKDWRILLLEPSAAQVLAVLALVDLRDGWNTGRFHFDIQEPGVQGILASLDRFNLWNFPDPALYVAPALRPGPDAAAWLEQYAQRSAAQRQQERIWMASFHDHPKRSSSVLRRVLLVDAWPNAVQSLHIRSVEDAMRRTGIATRRFTVEGYRFDIMGKEVQRLYLRELCSTLSAFDPDWILSYAYHAPQILPRDTFHEIGVPWVQVVSNLVYYDEGYFENEHVAVCERNLIPHYRKRGADHVFAVPLMANFCPEEPVATDGSLPVVFVGNSLGLNSIAVDAWRRKWSRRARLLPYVEEALQELGDFDRQVHIFQTLDTHPIPDVENEREHFEVYRYLLCQATDARRRRLLEALAPFGLVVYGNWEDRLPPDSPLHPCLRGFLPINQENDLYAQGSLFINIHSVGHVTSPNMRFFNIPALGGLQLTDGPFAAFLEPEVESVFFSSVAELVEKTAYFLAHPAEAEEIRRRGHARVQRQWTYPHWLEWVLREMNVQGPAVSPQGGEVPLS